MDIAELIHHLSNPGAYPHPADPVEVHQTHISAVFLAGPFAYKIKKPRNLGFLDFTRLERRRFYCDEEVRLNRRLAADTYLGVVPVGRGAGGDGLAVGGGGEVVEWAVQMRRLPASATLLQRLLAGDDLAAVVRQLGGRLRAFHEAAASGPAIAACGRWQVVADNAMENFQQAAPLVGRTVHPRVLRRLQARTRRRVHQLRDRIEQRVRSGAIRDTHGDLHLDHVYWFPEQRRFIVVDCIEFNERFRYADPVADLAFLVMDLDYHGRGEWAQGLLDAYFAGDEAAAGRELLPFYCAYRAAVRGKVEGFEVVEAEVPASTRGHALAAARAHWLLALRYLEPPRRRPLLLCIGGLPGSGKSTLAAALAEQAECRVIASDRVRKELAGMAPEQSAAAGYGKGIYSPRWSERTYSECLRRVREILFQGGRVIVDAGFGVDPRRREFLEEARASCVTALWLECSCSEDEVRRRLQARHAGVSDADWNIYRAARRAWQPATTATAGARRELRSDGPAAAVAQRATGLLRQAGVL